MDMQKTGKTRVLVVLGMLVSMGLAGVSSAGLVGPGTSGLVGLWYFDEGSGTTAIDSSGNGNSGT
ncbi:MAG: hypothetical protein KAJ19_29205, partial [Gammaproteobacteria bacterium]|nr:hypothetical protein [Gammaproteobacteria bacterium]